MDKKMEELLERMKAAKTEEEVLAIAKEMPRTELSEEALTNVAGGTGRIELTEEQTERVVKNICKSANYGFLISSRYVAKNFLYIVHIFGYTLISV